MHTNKNIKISISPPKLAISFRVIHILEFFPKFYPLQNPMHQVNTKKTENCNENELVFCVHEASDI